MKRVLITGGAGFIGYHLAKKLLSSNYKIDIIDNFSRAVCDSELKILSKNENIELLNIDLLDNNVLNEISDDYSYIYHLAAVIGVRHVMRSPYDVLDKNVLLLKNALIIAQKQKKIKRFVFASTSEVYAGTLKHHGLDFPTEEETPLTISNINNKRSSYMLSKIYGEAMCLHSGLPVTIIRPHNFYGPRMGLSHVIPELMKKVVKNKKDSIDVFSVDHKRTFCYVDDAIEMIKLLAESSKSIGHFYNVGNENEEITMGKLAQKIINLISKDIKVNPLPPTSGSPERRCPDISKLNKIISYKNLFSLEKGLKKTYEWYNKNIFSGERISAL
tara:strand:+ start:6039 stop:7028 length:990 start_codon:yes stop_codon:yes gene_type:complete